MSVSNIQEKITSKRIAKDVKALCESKDFETILYEPDNMEVLWVKFKLGRGYYKNQTHVLEIKLSTSAHKYPITAPNVRFLTPCFHTNVNTQGSICLSILKENDPRNPEAWTIVCTLRAGVQAIFLLLDLPNTESPFNENASKAWTECNFGKDEERYTMIADQYYFSKGYKAVIEEFDKLRNRT